MVLVQNWPFVYFSFLGNPARKMFFMIYFRVKKRLFRLYNQENKKVEKLRFFQSG